MRSLLITFLTGAAISCGTPQAYGGSCAMELMAKDAGALAASVEERNAGSFIWHGPGCYSDDPGNPDACDWETRIKSDTRIGDDRRLLVFTSDHKTGSGSWDYVRVYGCRAGDATLLFQDRFLYGVTIEKSMPDQIVFLSGYWSAADAQCCPPARARHTLRWDPGKGIYTKGTVDVLPQKTE